MDTKPNIWFTADLHFGHGNMLKHEPVARPYKTKEEMDAAMIRDWNGRVQPTDRVWVLGDLFCFCHKSYAINIRKQLNGIIWLVRGNHDEWSDTWYQEQSICVMDSPQPYKLGQGSIEVPVLLSHYPYKPNILKQLGYWLEDKKMLRHLERSPEDEGLPLLHGHVHSRWERKENMFNVGIDIHHAPISLRQVNYAFGIRIR